MVRGVHTLLCIWWLAVFCFGYVLDVRTSSNAMPNRVTAPTIIHPAAPASVALRVFFVCCLMRNDADNRAFSSSPRRPGSLRSNHHSSHGNEYRWRFAHLRHDHQLHHVLSRAGGVLNWLMEDSKRIDIRTVLPSSQIVLVSLRLLAAVSVVRRMFMGLAGDLVA